MNIHPQKQWLVVVLLLVAAVAYPWATWRYFTQPVPGGNDFLAHYSAWEAYLKQGLNPYSDAAALHTQKAIYGRPARPGEDQNRLTYPFYSILVHGPFVFIDYAWARALYMVLLQAALVAGVAFTLELVHWRPPNWLLTLLLTWSVLFYPEARGIILGQFAIFGFFALAGSLFLLRRGSDAAAGVLLVLATMKPTLVFLIVPFLMLWAIARRRWRLLVGFGATLALLVLGSLVMLPSWIGDWLYRVRQYPEYTVGQSPVWLLTHAALPVLGRPGEIALTATLLAALLWVWWRAVRPGGDGEFHWALGLTLVVSNLIAWRSATTNYVLMLVPILWILAALDRLGRQGRATVVGAMLAAGVGYWWLHFATVVGNQEHAIMFSPQPLIVGLTLVFGRHWLLDDNRQAGIVV